jgi:hypothetical protein
MLRGRELLVLRDWEALEVRDEEPSVLNDAVLGQVFRVEELGGPVLNEPLGFPIPTMRLDEGVSVTGSTVGTAVPFVAVNSLMVDGTVLGDEERAVWSAASLVAVDPPTVERIVSGDWGRVVGFVAITSWGEVVEWVIVMVLSEPTADSVVSLDSEVTGGENDALACDVGPIVAVEEDVSWVREFVTETAVNDGTMLFAELTSGVAEGEKLGLLRELGCKVVIGEAAGHPSFGFNFNHCISTSSAYLNWCVDLGP